MTAPERQPRIGGASPVVASVKRGGRATPTGYLFEISGGALALDLANTVDNRPSDKRRELLGAYRDLVDWGRQAGAIDASEAAALLEEASRRPLAARSALRRAREIREAIFEALSSTALGRAPRERAMARLNEAVGRSLAHLRLDRRGGDFVWSWDTKRDPLDRVVWPAVRSAAELLASTDLTRVRRCAAEDCDWLFLDRSKNGTRRWCDMSVCGNRAKVRRYRRGQGRGRVGRSRSRVRT